MSHTVRSSRPHCFFDLAMLSYFDLEEYHKAKGIMREGVVMTAKATQSRMCGENLRSKALKDMIPPSPGPEV